MYQEKQAHTPQRPSDEPVRNQVVRPLSARQQRGATTPLPSAAIRSTGTSTPKRDEEPEEDFESFKDFSGKYHFLVSPNEPPPPTIPEPTHSSVFSVLLAPYNGGKLGPVPTKLGAQEVGALAKVVAGKKVHAVQCSTGKKDPIIFGTVVGDHPHFTRINVGNSCPPDTTLAAQAVLLSDTEVVDTQIVVLDTTHRVTLVIALEVRLKNREKMIQSTNESRHEEQLRKFEEEVVRLKTALEEAKRAAERDEARRHKAEAEVHQLLHEKRSMREKEFQREKEIMRLRDAEKARQDERNSELQREVELEKLRQREREQIRQREQERSAEKEAEKQRHEEREVERRTFSFEMRRLEQERQEWQQCRAEMQQRIAALEEERATLHEREREWRAEMYKVLTASSVCKLCATRRQNEEQLRLFTEHNKRLVVELGAAREELREAKEREIERIRSEFRLSGTQEEQVYGCFFASLGEAEHGPGIGAPFFYRPLPCAEIHFNGSVEKGLLRITLANGFGDKLFFNATAPHLQHQRPYYSREAAPFFSVRVASGKSFIVHPFGEELAVADSLDSEANEMQQQELVLDLLPTKATTPREIAMLLQSVAFVPAPSNDSPASFFSPRTLTVSAVMSLRHEGAVKEVTLKSEVTIRKVLPMILPGALAASPTNVSKAVAATSPFSPVAHELPSISTVSEHGELVSLILAYREQLRKQAHSKKGKAPSVAVTNDPRAFYLAEVKAERGGAFQLRRLSFHMRMPLNAGVSSRSEDIGLFSLASENVSTSVRPGVNDEDPLEIVIHVFSKPVGCVVFGTLFDALARPGRAEINQAPPPQEEIEKDIVENLGTAGAAPFVSVAIEIYAHIEEPAMLQELVRALGVVCCGAAGARFITVVAEGTSSKLAEGTRSAQVPTAFSFGMKINALAADSTVTFVPVGKVSIARFGPRCPKPTTIVELSEIFPNPLPGAADLQLPSICLPLFSRSCVRGSVGSKGVAMNDQKVFVSSASITLKIKKGTSCGDRFVILESVQKLCGDALIHEGEPIAHFTSQPAVTTGSSASFSVVFVTNGAASSEAIACAFRSIVFVHDVHGELPTVHSQRQVEVSLMINKKVAYFDQHTIMFYPQLLFHPSFNAASVAKRGDVEALGIAVCDEGSDTMSCCPLQASTLAEDIDSFMEKAGEDSIPISVSLSPPLSFGNVHQFFELGVDNEMLDNSNLSMLKCLKTVGNNDESARGEATHLLFRGTQLSAQQRGPPIAKLSVCQPATAISIELFASASSVWDGVDSYTVVEPQFSSQSQSPHRGKKSSSSQSGASSMTVATATGGSGGRGRELLALLRSLSVKLLTNSSPPFYGPLILTVSFTDRSLIPDENLAHHFLIPFVVAPAHTHTAILSGPGPARVVREISECSAVQLLPNVTLSRLPLSFCAAANLLHHPPVLICCKVADPSVGNSLTVEFAEPSLQIQQTLHERENTFFSHRYFFAKPSTGELLLGGKQIGTCSSKSDQLQENGVNLFRIALQPQKLSEALGFNPSRSELIGAIERMLLALVVKVAQKQCLTVEVQFQCGLGTGSLVSSPVKGTPLPSNMLCPINPSVVIDASLSIVVAALVPFVQFPATITKLMRGTQRCYPFSDAEVPAEAPAVAELFPHSPLPLPAFTQPPAAWLQVTLLASDEVHEKAVANLRFSFDPMREKVHGLVLSGGGPSVPPALQLPATESVVVDEKHALFCHQGRTAVGELILITTFVQGTTPDEKIARRRLLRLTLAPSFVAALSNKDTKQDSTKKSPAMTSSQVFKMLCGVLHSIQLKLDPKGSSIPLAAIGIAAELRFHYDSGKSQLCLTAPQHLSAQVLMVPVATLKEKDTRRQLAGAPVPTNKLPSIVFFSQQLSSVVGNSEILICLGHHYTCMPLHDAEIFGASSQQHDTATITILLTAMAGLSLGLAVPGPGGSENDLDRWALQASTEFQQWPLGGGWQLQFASGSSKKKGERDTEVVDLIAQYSGSGEQQLPLTLGSVRLISSLHGQRVLKIDLDPPSSLDLLTISQSLLRALRVVGKPAQSATEDREGEMQISMHLRQRGEAEEGEGETVVLLGSDAFPSIKFLLPLFDAPLPPPPQLPMVIAIPPVPVLPFSEYTDPRRPGRGLGAPTRFTITAKIVSGYCFTGTLGIGLSFDDTARSASLQDMQLTIVQADRLRKVLSAPIVIGGRVSPESSWRELLLNRDSPGYGKEVIGEVLLLLPDTIIAKVKNGPSTVLGTGAVDATVRSISFTPLQTHPASPLSSPTDSGDSPVLSLSTDEDPSRVLRSARKKRGSSGTVMPETHLVLSVVDPFGAEVTQSVKLVHQFAPGASM